MADYLVFLDESIKDRAPSVEVTFACWGAESSRFTEPLPNLYHTPIEKHVRRLFDSINAVCLLSKANVSHRRYRTDEPDGTDDIPRMTRRNNIWSACAAFTIAGWIAILANSGRPLAGDLDVYFDDKSLTGDHRLVFESLLRETLTPIAHSYIRDPVAVRKICWVPKAQRRDKRNRCQAGVWVADRLTKWSKFEGCKIVDISGTVERAVRQFDGESF